MAPQSGQPNATPLVRGLFAASVLLSLVTWYTTFEGMSLYLTRWFAFLAATGIQGALLFVAWLIGFGRARVKQLVVVYCVAAIVSVTFSYASLYRWFSERERPAQVRRGLYDSLMAAAASTDAMLTQATAESRKHVLALEEMAQAEKLHGHISRSGDADPYLNRIREAVAREAQGVEGVYKEGTGQGVRYTAFDRYARIARESQQALETARAGIAAWRAANKATDPAEQQLRTFHTAYDAVPWTEVSTALHTPNLEKPAVPQLAGNIDSTSGGQEELLLAFTELFADPTSRHVFSLILAASFDIIIFLVAYVSGPHLQGSPEHRAAIGAAALDSLDHQVFTRDFLRKVRPAPGGLARIDARDLSPGEAQLLMILSSRGMATEAADLNQNGESYFLLNPDTHAALVESLSHRGVPLRAARAASA